MRYQSVGGAAWQLCFKGTTAAPGDEQTSGVASVGIHLQLTQATEDGQPSLVRTGSRSTDFLDYNRGCKQLDLERTATRHFRLFD